VQFYTEYDRFAFFEQLWGLGATYDVHHRLIVQLVVDFLLVLNFFRKVLRLRRYLIS